MRVSRKLTTVVAAVALAIAVLAAGGAGAAPSTTTVVGNVETEFGVGFSPKALPEKGAVPIPSSFWWNVRTKDGSHPPALKEFRIRSDKHAELDVKGVPMCQLPGSGPRLDPAAIRKACGPAIVGTGRIKGIVEFPGRGPVGFGGKLLAINGGVEGGVTSLFVHTFLAAPVTAEIVITMQVKRIHKGRYGMESITTIPKITSGHGSVTYFKLKLDKGIFLATCPDGRLRTRGTAVFADSTKAAATVVRPCTSKN